MSMLQGETVGNGKGHFYNVIHFCCGFALMTDETIDLMRLSLNLKVTKTLSSTMN